MTTFAPTEVRLSEIARGCSRMSVIRALGHEPAEPDEQTREYFKRGDIFERYVVEQLIAKHGRDNVRRQVEIRHPLGVGHADALIVSERLLVEIKSSTAPSTSTPVFENGVAQLKRYLRWCPDADTGALYMISPNTLKPADVFPVVLTDDDIDAIDRETEEIQAAIDSRELPDRVCSRPSMGSRYLCPFVAACFAGWEPEPPAEITDPVVLTAAATLAAIQKQKAEHKAAVAALEESEEEAKRILGDVLPEKGEAVAGPWLVKRWPVKGRRTFQFKAADAAGVDLGDLEQFVSVSATSDRFAVARAEQAGDVDFGEAPF